jgi:hypothetical protein
MHGKYRLIPGDQIWIVNDEDERFNPVFRLDGVDRKLARQILRNLNDPGRLALSPEITEPPRKEVPEMAPTAAKAYRNP